MRKLIHFAGILIPVVYLLTDRKTALAMAAAALAFMTIFEPLRIRGLIKIGIVEANTKESERMRPMGSFFYVLAGLIVIFFFDKSIAVASLFILAIADPLSGLVGRRFGRVHLFGKSLEGTTVFFASSFLILSGFSFPIHIAALAAIVAALTELFSSWPVDDNLSIPLASASALTLLMRLQ